MLYDKEKMKVLMAECMADSKELTRDMFIYKEYEVAIAITLFKTRLGESMPDVVEPPVTPVVPIVEVPDTPKPVVEVDAGIIPNETPDNEEQS